MFFLERCEGPIPETSGPADAHGGSSLAWRLRRSILYGKSTKYLCAYSSLRKLLACGFPCKLKCVYIPVNQANYVLLLLTAQGP